VRRTAGLVLLAVALVLAGIGWIVAAFPVPVPLDLPTTVVWKVALAGAVLAAAYGVYLLAARAIVATAPSKRRAHTLLTVLRLGIGVASLFVVFGLATERWLGVFFSLGVVGVAVTFALQQPLFSLIGWAYIVVKRPPVWGTASGSRTPRAT